MIKKRRGEYNGAEKDKSWEKQGMWLKRRKMSDIIKMYPICENMGRRNDGTKY